MEISLLALPDGHLSLEFGTSDLAAVAAAIRNRYGEPAVTRHLASAEYRFGGCSFTFQNEWDDPCMISGSPEGDAVLRALADAIDSAGRRTKRRN